MSTKHSMLSLSFVPSFLLFFLFILFAQKIGKTTTVFLGISAAPNEKQNSKKLWKIKSNSLLAASQLRSSATGGIGTNKGRKKWREGRRGRKERKQAAHKRERSNAELRKIHVQRMNLTGSAHITAAQELPGAEGGGAVACGRRRPKHTARSDHGGSARPPKSGRHGKDLEDSPFTEILPATLPSLPPYFPPPLPSSSLLFPPSLPPPPSVVIYSRSMLWSIASCSGVDVGPYNFWQSSF